MQCHREVTIQRNSVVVVMVMMMVMMVVMEYLSRLLAQPLNFGGEFSVHLQRRLSTGH